jgi:hypothetical protein
MGCWVKELDPLDRELLGGSRGWGDKNVWPATQVFRTVTPSGMPGSGFLILSRKQRRIW